MAEPFIRPHVERFYGARGDLCLCLSGGGFRAAAFHLGVLRWLYERGVLPHCQAIRSVSGGSLVSAWMVRCADIVFSKSLDIGKFDAEFVGPLLAFLGRDHRTGPILSSLGINVLYRQLRCQLLARRFATLFRSRECSNGVAPPVSLLSFDLRTASLVELSPAKSPDVLALQVVASAAFPPVFGPLRLEGRLMTDGGLATNLGVTGATTHLWRCVLVSDASRSFPRWTRGKWTPYSLRLLPLIRDGATRSYRDQLGSANSDTCIVGVAPLSSVDWFGRNDRLSMDLGRLGRLRTDLAGFSPALLSELVRFGSTVSDATFGEAMATWAVRTGDSADAAAAQNPALVDFLTSWPESRL